MCRCFNGPCTRYKFLWANPIEYPKGYQKYYNDLCKPIGECYNITYYIQSISSFCNNKNKIFSNFVYKEIQLFSLLLFGIISIYYKENSKYNNDKTINSNKIVKLK